MRKVIFALFSNSRWRTAAILTCSSAMAERPRDACFVFDQRPALFAKSQNCIFKPTHGGIRGNISALSESFNAEKLCSRVLSKESVLFVKQRSSVSEPPFVGLRGNVCDSSLVRGNVRTSSIAC